jgi:hypothetical protein
MFEQQSYDQQAPPLPTQPGDLFYEYEIKNWIFTPRLYKIMAISAIFNVVALLVVGSSGVLTARGCNSPFVGRVCQVLDTVYVGSLIFGEDTNYGDFDYTKTEMEDADVTFIDVTGVEPQLTYPEGYFALANPEQQFANMTDPSMQQPGFLAPGIPSNPTFPGGGGLLSTPPISPNNNPNPIEGDLPTGSPLGETADNPTIASGSKGNRRRGSLNGGTKTETNTNTNTASANSNTTNPTLAQNPEDIKEDKNGVFITKRPIKDRAKESLEKIENSAIKLDTPFKVIISATLGPGKEGKTVVLKNPKPVPSDPPYKNDPVMEKFVHDWILAVGDTGWFGYLDKLKTKKVLITVEQTDTEFLASVRADQPTENDARLAASGINGVLQIGAIGASGDELIFLQKGSATNDGKAFVLNFKIEKPVVKEMIIRKLAESKEQAPKPEGNALVKPSDQSAK